MTYKVKKLYKSAVRNKAFLQAIYDADKDTKPSILASDSEKSLFAAVYYGWLVSQYGIAWELYL